MCRIICASFAISLIAQVPVAIAAPSQAKAEEERVGIQQQMLERVEEYLRMTEEMRLQGFCEIWKANLGLVRRIEEPPAAASGFSAVPPDLRERWRQRATDALTLPCPPPGEQPQPAQTTTAGSTTPVPSETSAAQSSNQPANTRPEWDLKELDRKPSSTSSRKLAMIGAAGAAGAAALAAGGGGTTSGPATTAPPSPPVQQAPSPQPPTTPSPPAPPAPDSFNGTTTGELTVTENACGFPQSAGFSARLNVNSAGNGTLEFTYLAPGQQQLYVFNSVSVRMNGDQGSFEAETTSAQFGYRLIIQGIFSGSTLTGRISFFDPRRNNCHVGYMMRGRRT